MATIITILAGATVLYLSLLASRVLVLSRVPPWAPAPSTPSAEFAKYFGISVLVSACLTFLHLLRATSTISEAIAVGMLMSIAPAAVLLGVARRSGATLLALPRVVYLILVVILTSITVYALVVRV